MYKMIILLFTIVLFNGCKPDSVESISNIYARVIKVNDNTIMEPLLVLQDLKSNERFTCTSSKYFVDDFVYVTVYRYNTCRAPRYIINRMLTKEEIEKIQNEK